jgi:two-component system response regulator FlrC
MHLPPLRERSQDIVPIAQRLIARHCGGKKVLPSLATEAEARLVAYNWPGNIRELDNVVQRALVLSSGDTITADDILIDARSLWQEDTTVLDAVEDAALDDAVPMVMQDLKQQEIDLILKTLKANAGNRARTADILQLSPRTLRYKLAKLRDAGYDVE